MADLAKEGILVRPTHPPTHLYVHESRRASRDVLLTHPTFFPQGFAEVVSASDLRTGLSMLLQLCGIGGLRPNTCLLGWPDMRTLTQARALRFLEFIARAAVHEKAIVALKLNGNENKKPFPTSTQIIRGGNMDGALGSVDDCGRVGEIDTQEH